MTSTVTQLRTSNNLPVLREQAMAGLPGDVVAGLLPYTEASAPALLGIYLSFLSAAIGGRAYVYSGGRHPAIVSILLCGITGVGRKGTSVRDIKRLWYQVTAASSSTTSRAGSPPARASCTHVRDAATPTPRQQHLMDTAGKSRAELDIDPGIGDKRLLIIEEKFRNVLDIGTPSRARAC